MNTNLFPEIVNFLCVWAVVSGIRSFTRCGPLIMCYVYSWYLGCPQERDPTITKVSSQAVCGLNVHCSTSKTRENNPHLFHSFPDKIWWRVQYLANQFWSRWRAEFLPSLQEWKPPRWVAGPSQATSPVINCSHLYSWVERSSVRTQRNRMWPGRDSNP
jgi:hypothetical protein